MALSALIVTHIHSDGFPAAGWTFDEDSQPTIPWRDLGDRTLDEVERVMVDGAPGYRIDWDGRTWVEVSRLSDAIAWAMAEEVDGDDDGH